MNARERVLTPKKGHVRRKTKVATFSVSIISKVEQANITQLEVPQQSPRVYWIAAHVMHPDRRGKWWRICNLNLSLSQQPGFAIYQQLIRDNTRLPDERSTFDVRRRNGHIELRYHGNKAPPSEVAECFEFVEVLDEH